MKGRSRLFTRLRRDKMALVGFVFLLTFVTISLLAPWIAPYDPWKQNWAEQLAGPTHQHVLGTDEYGRDVLSRLIFGGRTSLVVGVMSVLIGAGVGIPLGVASAVFGGLFEEIVMRIMDVLLAFPMLLLALTVIAALGPGMQNVMLAIGVAMVPFFARLARGQALEVKGYDFVEAAAALGAGKARLMFRHILPNILSTLVVAATLYVAFAIRAEAGISFLGLGVSPPTPTWGNMISEGRNFIQFAPWIATSAGTTIMLVILSFNLVGDALRDVFDPREER